MSVLHKIVALDNRFSNEKKYWEDKLSGEFVNGKFPYDFGGQNCGGQEYSLCEFELDHQTSSRLVDISNHSDKRLFILLMTGIKSLHFLYTSAADNAIGTSIYKQQEEGELVNSILPVRDSIDGNTTFKDLLLQVRKTINEAYENANYPMEYLWDGLKENNLKLFDSAVILLNIHDRAYLENVMPALVFSFIRADGIIKGSLEYDTKRYGSSTIQHMIGHMSNLLKAVTGDISVKISDIDILSPEETNRILFEFNDTAAAYRKDMTIHGMFEEQVDKTPENIALAYGNRNITYMELNRKSNLLARQLRKKGIERDRVVAILMERSPEMIISALGVLKAGGAYLPIDAGYPEERIKYMLEDSGTKVLLTEIDLAHHLEFEGEIVDLRDESLYEGDASNTEHINLPSDLAYIIYTSGTTGKPKGTMIEHKNVVRLLSNDRMQFDFNQNDVWTMFHSFCFDFSVWEMYGALLNGGKLIIVPRHVAQDAKEFLKLIQRERVTVLNQTPTAFYSLVDMEEAQSESCLSIRYVIFGGESLKPVKLKEWKLKYPGIKFINMYGITETTVHVTYKEISTEEIERNISNIGRPIPTTTVYIMDSSSKLLPVGAAGEICVGGDGVGRGYLNRPELTEQKFVNSPYKKMERIYRSGDLGRILPNGEIEYLGRIDQQVKIRGHRIELSEIEVQLLSHLKIKEAVVLASDGNNNDRYLCAYFVADEDLTVSGLRSYLKGTLPEYMIPAYFIQMDKLPVNSNGKLDRKALPSPGGNIATGEKYEAPGSDIEEKLVKAWSEVLGIERISINDSFLALGGDSIKAMKLMPILNNYNLKLEIKDLFQFPTIKELGKHVETSAKQIDQGMIEGKIALTPIQKWFFSEHIQNKNHFNQSILIYRKTRFDENIVMKTISKIVEHHDALRMVYRQEDRRWVQFNRGIGEGMFAMEIIDFQEETDYKARLNHEADKLQKRLDISEGPLVRLGLFKTFEGDYLLIVIHHLVVDGVSWRIILDDFVSGYTQAVGNEDIKLADKTESFRKWASVLEDYSESKELLVEIDYWKTIKQYHEEPLPADGAATGDKHPGSIITVSLPEEETDRLFKSARKAYSLEYNEVLLTALGLALQEWTGKNSALLNIEGHGREKIDGSIEISRTVGWFTSIFPVVINVSDGGNIYESLMLVSNILKQIPNKGVGYGILKYLTPEKFKNEISFDNNPQICFNFFGQFDKELRKSDFYISNLSAGNMVDQNSERLYSLDLNCVISEGQLQMLVNYDQHEFKIETIQKFADSFQKRLMDISSHCTKVSLTCSSQPDHQNICNSIYPKANSGPNEINVPFPLTDVQLAYLMGRDNLFEMGGVSTHSYMEIETKLDIMLLEKSLQKVIRRHPMLRAIVHHDGQQQILEKVPDYKIIEKDISDLDAESQMICIADERKRMSHFIFKTDQWPLFELKAFRMSEDTSYLFFGRDLLIFDAASMQIIGKDLIYYYMNPDADIKELDFTFRDYIMAYREFKNTDIYVSDKKYWLDKLAGFPQAPVLPIKNIKKGFTPHFKRFSRTINKVDWEKLKSIARQKNITPSALICTAYTQVLSYWSNQSRLAVNLTVFNRYPVHKDVNDIVGDFTSVVLLGIELKPHDSFWECARHVQQVLMEALEHRHYDGVEFIREISKYNDLGTKAAMPIVFTSLLFGDANSNVNHFRQLGEIKMGIGQTSQVYIDNQATEIDGNLEIWFEFVDELFENNVIESIFDQYTGILMGLIISSEGHRLSPCQNDRNLINSYNKTQEEINPDTLHGMFVKQAGFTPDKIAVISEQDSITYNNLHIMSNQVANYLQGQGIGRNDLVGLSAKRCINTIINMLGILKTGAAYVPIDPEYPQERKDYILSNSNCKMMLYPELYPDKSLVDESTEFEAINNGNGIAYIIYTSGSTGRPKGVIITHEAVTNTIIDINRKFMVNVNDRIIGLSSMCFDLSVYDIFGALSTGAALVMVSNQRDASLLQNIVSKQGVTIWNSVPAIMDMMLDNLEDGFEGSGLRLVLLSGDWIPVNLPNKIKRYFPGSEVISLGGATEASIWSIYYPVTQIRNEWKSIPYGMPLANQMFYVLNYEMELCPVGVPGELYIGGVGLAKGYYNDEEKTRNAFIIHHELGNLYRTGDYGTFHSEGYIEFLGRKDHQVKIKGYRIELNEIENCLIKHPAVKNTAVIDRSDADGKKYLCAYYCSDAPLGISDMRMHLAKELPEYMIPSCFIQMDEIPLTSNGKLDRKSLPEPDVYCNKDNSYIAPRNSTEDELASILEDVLGIAEAGITDNFFELGGDSLKAQTFINRIHKKLLVKVPIIYLFKEPTIEKISEYILKGSSARNTEQQYKPAEEVKYYWSPVVHWSQSENAIHIEMYSYKGIAPDLFPKLYFITQKGVTLSELLNEFSEFDENDVKNFVSGLINNRVLVDRMLTYHEISYPQSKFFKNPYGEELLYDSEAYDDFKKHQMNRSFEKADQAKILLQNRNDFPAYIKDRRSYRVFDESREIPFSTFSQLLSVFMQQREKEKITYFYPSAGGLYSIDVFIYIKENRVEGVKKGLYYYSPIDNSLQVVNDTDELPEDIHYHTNKAIYKSSAFSVFLIYDASVNMPKYGPLGYFFGCIDSGIIVSSLTQSAELVNIGLCSIGDMDFKKIEKLFCLDENQTFIHAIEGGLKPDLSVTDSKDAGQEHNRLTGYNSSGAAMSTTGHQLRKQEYYPVSSAQKRLFLLQLLQPESTGYNIQDIKVIEGKLDIVRIEDTFKKLINRHESLRTSFEAIEGELKQRIWENADFKLGCLEAGEQNLDLLVKGLVKPFILAEAPLFRVSIIRTDEDRYVLFLDMHHIISDGTSAGILMKDFITLYSGADLEELKIQYKDYTIWHNKFIKSDIAKEQEKYWLEVFSGNIPVLNIPTDFPRPDMQSFEGNVIKFCANGITAKKLKGIAAEKGSTLYMVLIAAYYVLLSKYSAQEDIVVGTPIAGRLHSDFEDTIGMFSNMLALRNYPAGQKLFSEFLEEVKQNTLNAFENQGFQFEELVNKLGLKRDVSRSPLFDTVFVLQNTFSPLLQFDNFRIKEFDYNGRSALYDILLEAYEQADNIYFNFYYCDKLFKKDTISRMSQDYLKILSSITENNNMKLSEIEIGDINIKKPKASRQEIQFNF